MERMNRGALKWLYGELPRLVSADVLTSSDERRIRGHYGEVPSNTPIFLAGCAILGALLVGLGVILILAHNWESLPRALRAAISLSTLLAGQLAVVATLVKTRDTGWKEASAMFLVGICVWAVMGGDTWFLGGEMVFGKGLWFWPLAAAMLPHFLRIQSRKGHEIRASILSFAFAATAGVAAYATIGKFLPNPWTLVLPCFFSVLCALGDAGKDDAGGWRRPLRRLGGIGLVLTAFALTYQHMWSEFRHGTFFWNEAFGPAALADYALVAARFFDSDIHFVTKGVVFILMGAGFFIANVRMLAKKRRPPGVRHDRDGLRGIRIVRVAVGSPARGRTVRDRENLVLGRTAHSVRPAVRSLLHGRGSRQESGASIPQACRNAEKAPQRRIRGGAVARGGRSDRIARGGRPSDRGVGVQGRIGVE